MSKYVAVYFYNVYGPRERAGVDTHGTVIETFRQQYMKGEPLAIREPGTQSRAFTHVEDTVSAIMLASEKGENEEFGICADDTYSLLDIAHMLGGEIVMLPPTKSTRSTQAVDSSKLIALGWEQKHSLKEYLEQTKK